MSCSGITIIQDARPITIIQDASPVTVLQTIEVIQVCAQNPVAQFLPFYFVATQGQTTFTLPAIALSMILVAINGTSQSEAGGDFTVNETVLTLDAGVDSGDLVFGVIQIA